MFGEICFIQEGKKISYKLSVAIDVDKDDKYYMPSLSFYESYGLLNEKLIECWDNEDYLIDTLLKNVLKPYIDSVSIPSPIEFAQLVSLGVALNEFKLLAELLEKGIEKGFFIK